MLSRDVHGEPLLGPCDLLGVMSLKPLVGLIRPSLRLCNHLFEGN